MFVSACPAQRTCVADGSAPTSLTMTSPRAMRRLLAPLVANAPPVPPPAVPPERVATEPADVLQTPGIQHVMRLLDGIENGLYSDLSVVEPYACPLGCFGSPLLWEEPFVARYRWRQVAADFAEDVPAVRRETPLRAREGVRLDADMDRAIAKLAKIEKLARALPGRNCGMCGAPNCSTFAEDVVLGRARVTGCPGYVNARKDRQ